MDELPEPTPEAIKKANRYYWTAYVVAMIGLVALWISTLILGDVRVIAPFLTPINNLFKHANPVFLASPVATWIANIACRRSKVSLEVRSRELIYVERSLSHRSSDIPPITVSSEKTLAHIGVALGIFFAILTALPYLLGRGNVFDALNITSCLLMMVALWSGVAWRWGKWSVATIDSNGVTLHRNNPWLLQKVAGEHRSWSEIDSVEVGRARNAQGAETAGWINLFDKGTQKRRKIPQGLINPAKWQVFRERVRTEARHDDPIVPLVEPTFVRTQTSAAQSEAILLQRQ